MPTEFDLRARDWDNDPRRIARASAVAEAIKAAVALNPSMSALDYGCGTGLLSFALQPWLGSITLADTSTEMLAVTGEKIAAAGLTRRGGFSPMTPLQLDLTRDPLPAARYDLIYTLMTLHHILDTSAILDSFSTLLKPGGHLCIADLDLEDGSFHGTGVRVHPGYERSVLAAQLAQAGLAHIRFSTCFEMPKAGRVYPLFLAVGAKR